MSLAKADPKPPPLLAHTVCDKNILHLLRCAHPELTRYAMRAVYVDNGPDDRARYVTTNGKALAMFTRGLPCPQPAVGFATPLKPFTADAVSVRDLFKGAKTGETRDLSDATPLEGRFPPYLQVLPKDTDKTHARGSVVSTSALRQALKSVVAFRGKSLASAVFKVSPSGCDITLRVPEVGNLEMHTYALDLEGQTAEAGFDPALMLDCLEAVRATGCGATPETLKLEWPLDGGPMIIRHNGPNGDIVVILMPVLL